MGTDVEPETAPWSATVPLQKQGTECVHARAHTHHSPTTFNFHRISFFETGCHVVQATFELAMQSRIAMNSWSSFPHLQSSGIGGVCPVLHSARD